MRTVLVTPCFAPSSMLFDCLDHIYKTPPDIEHYVLSNYYPINEKQNNTQIKWFANHYGCTLIDSGSDLGLHKSLNNAVEKIGLTHDDILIVCDPDDRPSPGFAETMTKVMRADPSLAVLGAGFWVIDERIKFNILTKETISDQEVWMHPSVEMINVAAFNMKFIHAIDGFNQPHGYYGGLESYLYSKWKPLGLRLGYLQDVRSDAAPVDRNDPRLFDPEFRLWKNDHVAGFAGSFKEWLQLNAPHKL